MGADQGQEELHNAQENMNDDSQEIVTDQDTNHQNVEANSELMTTCNSVYIMLLEPLFHYLIISL